MKNFLLAELLLSYPSEICRKRPFRSILNRVSTPTTSLSSSLAHNPSNNQANNPSNSSNALSENAVLLARSLITGSKFIPSPSNIQNDHPARARLQILLSLANKSPSTLSNLSSLIHSVRRWHIGSTDTKYAFWHNSLCFHLALSNILSNCPDYATFQALHSETIRFLAADFKSPCHFSTEAYRVLNSSKLDALLKFESDIDLHSLVNQYEPRLLEIANGNSIITDQSEANKLVKLMLLTNFKGNKHSRIIKQSTPGSLSVHCVFSNLQKLGLILSFDSISHVMKLQIENNQRSDFKDSIISMGVFENICLFDEIKLSPSDFNLVFRYMMQVDKIPLSIYKTLKYMISKDLQKSKFSAKNFKTITEPLMLSMFKSGHYEDAFQIFNKIWQTPNLLSSGIITLELYNAILRECSRDLNASKFVFDELLFMVNREKIIAKPNMETFSALLECARTAGDVVALVDVLAMIGYRGLQLLPEQRDIVTDVANKWDQNTRKTLLAYI